MLVLNGKVNSYYIDDEPLAKGGEGAVFRIKNADNIVAKIYFNPTKELEEKLTYMSKNQPDKSVINDIAWPLDILYNKGTFCGFIMPKMETATELGELYKFDLSKEPILTYQHRIIIAINICEVISAVHDAGYTFGDFNPANIGVNLNNGHVGFFDTDSYHIYDKTTGKTYRCGVCLNGYVAPELIQQCKGKDYLSAPLPTFTQETDRFSLAIHIFKLLMNGFTPFNGIKDTETVSSASPGLGNLAIERDNYCFKPGYKPQSLAVPSLSSFPKNIQNLFTRAFIDGRKDPKCRPTATDWQMALIDYYKNEIKECSKDKNHYYYKMMPKCPYCEAEKRYIKNLYLTQGQMSFSQPINVPNYSNNYSHRFTNNSGGYTGRVKTSRSKNTSRHKINHSNSSYSGGNNANSYSPQTFGNSSYNQGYNTVANNAYSNVNSGSYTTKVKSKKSRNYPLMIVIGAVVLLLIMFFSNSRNIVNGYDDFYANADTLYSPNYEKVKVYFAHSGTVTANYDSDVKTRWDDFDEDNYAYLYVYYKGDETKYVTLTNSYNSKTIRIKLVGKK